MIASLMSYCQGTVTMKTTSLDNGKFALIGKKKFMWVGRGEQAVTNKAQIYF